jgi:multiple antibiotic resistance protein
MNIDIKELISATMILFAVIDVIGNIPLILVLRQKFKIIESEKASIISLSIMILFLYLGEVLLNLLGVDIHSFAIAGSVIILFIAMEMILGIRIYRDDNPKTASIVPIAFPLIAGPGTLTTLISIKSEFEDINIILAIIINMILVYIVLKSSEKIEKILGIQGINVLRKIFF